MNYDDWKAAREAQNAALARFGFGERFDAGGGLFGGAHFTTCLTCGAAVPLPYTAVIAEGEGLPDDHPLNLHLRWHRDTGASAGGRQNGAEGLGGNV